MTDYSSYENINHFCYYNPDTRLIIGVSPEIIMALINYPYEQITFEQAKPFYNGEHGFNTNYMLLKNNNEVIILEKNTHKKITKNISNMPLSKLDNNHYNKNNISEYDLILELGEYETKLHYEVNPQSFKDYNLKLFVTPKNNPFFLVNTKIINSNQKNNNFKDYKKYSIFTYNNINIAICNNYDYNKLQKPFLLIDIEDLDLTIITTNTKFFNYNFALDEKLVINEKINNKFVKMEYTINDLTDNFIIAKNKELIISNNYEIIKRKLFNFTPAWVNYIISAKNYVNNSNKIFYNRYKLFIFKKNTNDEIIITEKNNPYVIIKKLNNDQIINYLELKSQIDAYIVDSNKNLTKIECEKINDKY